MEASIQSVNNEPANAADGNACLQKLFVALSRIIGDDKLKISLTEAITCCDQMANRQDLDPHLRHYLERRSYGKAHRLVQEIL